MEKFLQQMKDDNIVKDSNREGKLEILDAKKYKEEFAKFKAKLK